MTHITVSFLAMAALTACTATLPTSKTPSGAAMTLLTSGPNSNAVVGAPRKIYERVAKQASLCWFGPFGSVHDRYIMHADVPPPASSAPVTMAIHRRLKSRKKPWGPALLRIEMSGKSATTLTFQNVGLPPQTLERMTNGFIRWANGRTACTALHGAEPQWAPLSVSTQQESAPQRR